MSRWRKIALRIILVLNVQYLLVSVTGNLHVYDTLLDTIFKGRLGPSIYDEGNYPSRTIDIGNYAPWKKSPSYNQREYSKALRQQIESTQPVSFVVAHRGELVHEEYWEGFSDTIPTNSWSMAKSYISMLVGVAIKEGKIKSVNDKVSDYLPSYSEGLDADLTIKHLLTMTSGIDFGENYLNPFSFMAKALYGNEIRDLTLSYHVSYPPGTKWHYQGGNNILLGLILLEATGRTPSDYFSHKIWHPIEAKEPAEWSLDTKGGYEKGYCCFFSNAKDFARLGQLMLQQGNWKGEQILDTAYISNSVIPINVPDHQGQNTDQYGYAWWLTEHNGFEIFYARGINGQYTIIIPEKELVVVRLGHKRIKEKGAKHPKDVYFYIDAALELIQE